MSWTDEMLEFMKPLYAEEGLSASRIAEAVNMRFGSSYSRNAIIGKLHRMGWVIAGRLKNKTVTNSASLERAKKRKELAARKLGTSPLQALLRSDAFPLPASTEELVIPLHERKQLVDLEANDCRWPIGDPMEDGFHFCGRGKVQGISYCAHHARKAFAPPIVRTGHTAPFTLRMGATGQQRPMPAGASQKRQEEEV